MMDMHISYCTGMHKFKQLTKEERKKFVMNVISIHGERNLSDKLVFFRLGSAFTWSDTPQGHVYWMVINNRILCQEL
jgi:hypothetical protein